jgi:hypothetical protein
MVVGGDEMFNNPYNPYNSYYQQVSQQTPILPHQQIIQVNGKASVDTIQLAPNSSILVMDTSAPIVWMCISDGVGKVTATPYDIVIHQEEPPVDMKSIENRLANIENIIAEMEDKINAKPNVSRTKSKSSLADGTED